MSAFKLATTVSESTVKGEDVPETPPLKDGRPVTFSFSPKLKYEGAAAVQTGSVSLVRYVLVSSDQELSEARFKSPAPVRVDMAVRSESSGCPPSPASV
ncbi:MAG: hypothetical protein BWX66_01884 [Deltaproteobacteria bacterium ADurb.Bin058]|nr:MAG: hypothetical protein BWX66_01884 [Deltaproteobacteria bacterium ADurb.Bin058]